MKPIRTRRRSPIRVAAPLLAAVLAGAGSLAMGDCGPFTDITDAGFCPFVLEIFALGITTGTTPATYDPTSSVSRLQMAAFLSRTVDGALKRGSRRAAIGRFWSTQSASALSLTTVGSSPAFLAADEQDVWATSNGNGTVAHIRGTDGKLLETWTGAASATGVLTAFSRIFVAGGPAPGRLYRIDPTQPPGAVATVVSTLGDNPFGIASDGSRIWTTNVGNPLGTGSLSIATQGRFDVWSATTVTAGFVHPYGILFDGGNIWITDRDAAGRLLKLDSAGAVAQTVGLQSNPGIPVYDGTNIWVPNSTSNSVSIVRASSGTVLQTLTGNGLDYPFSAAFDGQRVLVANTSGNSVSLWKAADLAAQGSVSTGPGTSPYGACSDGINFWISLKVPGQIARF